MESKSYEMTILVREINRMNEENQKLNVMLKQMSSSYNDLQKHVGSLLEKKQRLTGIDRSEICNGNEPSNDNLNSRILSPKSVHVDSSGAVSRQSCFLSNCHERVQEMEGKKAKFIEDQLPSKKRKMNYVHPDQIQNGGSFMDDGIICDESPNKKHKALSNWSSEQMADAPKRIVAVRTTSETSLISDGCHWRKYGQKTTRNNPRPRSYYKCSAAPSCPVKKQVQRSAEDPTIVVTTYEGEHTHSLSPLAMAVMNAGLSNQLIGERLNRENFLADKNFIPFSTARISTFSTFPTITLDFTENQLNPAQQVKQPNPGLHLQPSHLTTGSFQHLIPLPKDMGNLFDHSTSMDSVASIKSDANYTAADFMLKLGAPTQEMPRYPPGT